MVARAQYGSSMPIDEEDPFPLYLDGRMAEVGTKPPVTCAQQSYNCPPPR
jgi:hypothetical protein